MPLAPSRRFGDARGVAATCLAAAALACFPIVIAFARHDGAPVGADTPVYVWWARLVGAVGGSTLAFRPGVPDATELIAHATGLPETAVVAGLGCALIAIVGLAGSALLRGGGARGGVALVGLMLTGLFGTYLAAGHLSNAVFAASFVLALAFAIEDGRWAAALAAASLGAAGLPHPQFLVLALAVLAGAGAPAATSPLTRGGTSVCAAGPLRGPLTGAGLLAP